MNKKKQNRAEKPQAKGQIPAVALWRLVRWASRWAWQTEIDRLQESSLEWASSSDRNAEKAFNLQESYNCVRARLAKDGFRAAWRCQSDQVAWMLVKRAGGTVKIDFADLPTEWELLMEESMADMSLTLRAQMQYSPNHVICNSHENPRKP